MGLSFIDLIIIASVILCIVVFLILLNWISKQGDRENDLLFSRKKQKVAPLLRFIKKEVLSC